MFRHASLLIAILLVTAGSSSFAQQNDGGQGTTLPAGVTADPLQPSLLGGGPGTPPPPPAPLPSPVATPSPASVAQDTNSLNSFLKTASAQSVSRTDVQAIAVQAPPEDSPFFIERQEARDAAANAGRAGFGMYVPKPQRPPAREVIAKFFRDHFTRKKKGKKGPAPMNLTIDPSDFSLAQTSQIDVSLRVTDAAKHELEFIFPDTQRIEIVVKDAEGTVVSRWSEDRTFGPRVGFTEINPQEFIVFTERLSTTGMKAGETYTVEASLANQEDYKISGQVTPHP